MKKPLIFKIKDKIYRLMKDVSYPVGTTAVEIYIIYSEPSDPEEMPTDLLMSGTLQDCYTWLKLKEMEITI